MLRRTLAFVIVVAACSNSAPSAHVTTSSRAPAPATTTTIALPVAPRTATQCRRLTATRWSDGSRVIASEVTGDACKVSVVVPARINVVVELPRHGWNGRYQAFGGGGFDGSLFFLGLAAPALASGYVISVTDTGHQGSPLTGAWAWSKSGLRSGLIDDFAYRANHEMTVKTKDLTRAFYGIGPRFSYWNGCSSGGREGLTEATRYPNDFDGIVALSPAINWTRMVAAGEWPPVIMHLLGDYLPGCKAAAATAAVMRACDGTADGAHDGLIDPRACHFDARSLVGTRTGCGMITAVDAAVINKIWQGPRDGEGRFLWYGLEPGTNLAGLGATATRSDGRTTAATPFGAADDWFRYFIHERPSWTYRDETLAGYAADFDKSVTSWARDFATNDSDLTAFERHGGKIVIWHGLADQLIPPQGTIRYYDSVVQRMGGAARVSEFARLFLSPNSPHCDTGNAGPYPVDPVAAVVKWREQAIPPNTIRGSGTNPAGHELTRDLCAYPQRTAYNGSGDVLDAKNFHCVRS